MIFGFIAWVFLIGIIVACLQDLKRREVDYWLTLFLLLISFSYIFYRAIFEENAGIVFQAGFALVVMFVFMNVFYYGRVFAGGDANLLFAMTAFFIGVDFFKTLINIGVFLLFLMVAGSFYGLFYSFILYFRNYKKVNREIRKGFREWWIRYPVFIGLLFLVFSYYNLFFLLFAGFSFVLPVLFVFTKGLENVSMIKVISGKELREGDWLVDDIKVGKKTIKADWDGLSAESIKLLKSRKKVKIKDGLPFVPAFLIAFALYMFFTDWLIGVLMGLT